MKLLFLRGQVPSDRNPKQIMFNKLSDNDDMWTQLANSMISQTNGYGELWYEKGHRDVRYSGQFVERWVPRYASAEPTFIPNVIFARGGFEICRAKAAEFAHAFKIYYGAGERVIPKSGQDWDLVLVDTHKQLDMARKNGYRAELFVKPAADNIFHPIRSTNPQYDVIYVANFNANANKGHRWLLPALKGYKVLHVGINRKGWGKKYPNTTFHGWTSRRGLPALYSQAKVAVVMTAGKDSCPRVIPEALACNTPLLVSEGTRFWHDKYISPESGRLWNKDNFKHVLDNALQNVDSFKPRWYYERELALPVAAKHIIGLIGPGAYE